MTSLENSSDKIHYHVTRPQVAITDQDGQGNFNISPLGFPIVDESTALGQNPTRLTPRFIATYENQLAASIDYTENNNNISSLYGLQAFTVGISSITWSGGTATVTTSNDHGFVNGKTVTISGATPTAYNGDYTITYISTTQFSYSLVGDPGGSSSTGTATYQSIEKDIVKLEAQTNTDENATYIVRNIYWQEIAVIIKSNSTSNIDLTTGGLITIAHTITSISGDGTTVTVKTSATHGLAEGNSITISGTTSYDGTYSPIFIEDGDEFTYEDSAVGAETSGTATYQTLADDAINVINQTTESENGIYFANASSWVFYGKCYEYDGTENDNLAGDYGTDVDADGNAITHYRRGYSHKEVVDYLREKLDTTIEFGRYRGSKRSDHGALVRWLMGGRRVNIGGDGIDREIYVDPFGFGDPENQLTRVNGDVNPLSSTEVSSKQTEINRLKKYAKWGLTNHHSNSFPTSAVENKSPYVKDWPFVYNTEMAFGLDDGGQISSSVDSERWRLTLNGVSDTNIRPFEQSILYYQRDNSYHNNITLDLSNSNVYGRQHISLVHNLDAKDDIPLVNQDFSPSDVNITTDTITVTDGSYFRAADRVRFTSTGTLPAGLVATNNYDVKAVSTNDITLYEEGTTTDVDITDQGTGTHTIHLLVDYAYNNDEVITALDDVIDNASFSTGIHILKKVTSGTVVKYYFEQREKGSLTDIITKGSGWTETTLTYDNVGANDIRIYLESTETDYVKFSHPTKTTVNLLTDLKTNNNLIPKPFDPSTVNVNTLNELFTHNTLIDYTDAVNQSEKIRSKKMFVHLPTPLGLSDGQSLELDFSLPIDPDTSSFPYNTVGSLSGYRNFVSQPRIYVLSGFQECTATDITVSTLTRSGNTATVTTTSNHAIHSQDFATSDVDTTNNYITMSDITQFNVGDTVRFYSTTTLPAPLSVGTTYVISKIDEDRIRLNGITLTDVGVGTHTITILNTVRLIIKGANEDDYNGEFDANITDVNKFQYTVENSPTTPATGTIKVERIIYVEGRDGAEGLSERSNSQIFGVMPEVEFGEDGSIYHQPPITSSDLTGNGSTDKRALIATIYPTSTNTFSWRLDNDPQLRMFQWSLLGFNASTGSAAHVAYNRNKALVDEFTGKFDFTLYENPLTYNSTVSYAESDSTTTISHLLNSYIRILLPEKLVPSTGSDYLTEDEIDTYASYVYQASLAYESLITDFHRGKILVQARSSTSNFETDALNYEMGYNNGSSGNNNSSTAYPTSFYDQTSSTQRFIAYDVTETPDSTSSNGYRWITKGIYSPEYIVEAEGATELLTKDPYEETSTTFKTYLSQYFITDKERENNAGDRFIPGDLNPSVDPSFEFGAGSEYTDVTIAENIIISTEQSLLVQHLVNNSEKDIVVDDLRRRLWDSYFEIPNYPERKMDDRFFIADQEISNTKNITALSSFYGFHGIPFTKIFSTDAIAPSENSVTGIDDYSTIRGGSYSEVENTLENALKSNPISHRFFAENDYDEATATINTRDTVGSNSDLEDYLRNYISGYSNRMPLRFYNSFRIVIHGKTSSSAHSTDDTLVELTTKAHVDRIYNYSVKHYLNEFGDTPPSSEIGQYVDDNYIFENREIDSGKVVAEDYNDTWLYFEDGDNVTANIKDLITVSGMPYLTDRTFYTSTMTKNYIRVKTKFIFSRKAGRWIPLDYRQFPTSYLTPVFGNCAMSYQEKSVIYAGNDGTDTSHYVPIIQPNPSRMDEATVLTDRTQIEVYTQGPGSPYGPSPAFGTTIIYNEEGPFTSSTPYLTVTVESIYFGDYNPITGIRHFIYTLNETIPNSFGSTVTLAYLHNTIDEGTYPYNLNTNTFEKDSLWKNSQCFTPETAYEYLYSTLYHRMEPMNINRFSIPFLSASLPYDSDGNLKDELDPDSDPTGAENYRFSKLLNPVNEIDFVVPSDIHGGCRFCSEEEEAFDARIDEGDPDRDLFIDFDAMIDDPVSDPDREDHTILDYHFDCDVEHSLTFFTPHMWKVYWHIRPAISAMFGTDIPAKTTRTGGNMSDPVLNSMFETWPVMNSREYFLPYHGDMGFDWLSTQFSLINAEIDDPVGNIDRTSFSVYDAEIDDPVLHIDRDEHSILDAQR